MSRIDFKSTVAVIVSQDETVLTIARETLHQLNYQVVDAEDTTQPHLVLFDWSMPLTPRWEQQFARSVVLAILPENDDPLVNLALDHGVHEIIRKPLNPRLLALRLRTLAALYQISSTRADENARRIFNLVADYVYILSILPDGQRQRKWWDEDNLKKMTGFTYSQIDAGGGWPSIVHPDDRGIVAQQLQNLLLGQSGVLEYRIIDAAGEVRWLRDYADTFVVGDLTHIYGAIQDITAEKKLEIEQAEQRHILNALHHISIILNSTLDFEEILDRILTVIGTVLPHDLSDVMLVENGVARIVRHRGFEEGGVDARVAVDQLRFSLEKHRATRSAPYAANLNEMVKTGQVVIINDVRNSPDWIRNDDIIDWEQAHIGAPIYVGDRVAGFLNLSSRQPNTYTEQHAYWLKIFASHVSVAISNAQLYDSVKRHSAELEQRVRDLVVLHRVGQALTSTLDPSQIYRVLFDEVIKNVFKAHSMCVLMLEEKTNALLRVFTVIDGEIASRIPLPVNVNTVRQAIATHKSCMLGNSLYEPMLARNRVVGVLIVQLQDGRLFDDVEATLFSIIVTQAAIALENAHLVEAIRQSNAQLEQRVSERTAELLKALEKERELSNLKSRFVSTVSHEFRTPLTAILSANEMLEHYNDRMSDEQRVRRFEIVRNAVAEMVRMLEDSTAMNEATTGQMVFAPEQVDLVAYTREIVDEFRAADNHEIEFYADHNQVPGFVDKVLWRKIIRELLLNAAKYSKPHQRIECHIEAGSTAVTLEVKDEGMGIPVDDLPYVFDIFFRGANAANIHGTGLGLAIVKYAVELHGGTITIQPGQPGTLIQLTIPKYTEGDKNDENSRN